MQIKPVGYPKFITDDGYCVYQNYLFEVMLLLF